MQAYVSEIASEEQQALGMSLVYLYWNLISWILGQNTDKPLTCGVLTRMPLAFKKVTRIPQMS